MALSYRKVSSRTINNEVLNKGNIDLFLKPVGFGTAPPLGNSVTNSTTNALLTSNGSPGIVAQPNLTFDGTTLKVIGSFILQNSDAPTSSTSTGVPGQFAGDTNFIYFCVAPNTWKRSALTTWKTKVRYIKVFFSQPTDGTIQIAQLAVYSNGINIAPNGIPSAANTLGFGSTIEKPIDGTLSPRGFPDIYHSFEPSEFGYWLLDLGGQGFEVERIEYYNRSDGDHLNDRAIGMLIETYDKNFDINFPDQSVPLNQFTLNGDLTQTFDL